MIEVKITTIERVEQHPESDKYDINHLTIGVQCISDRAEPGVPRWKIGDILAHIPENAILPNWLMKTSGYWDHEKDRGALSGNRRNRVKNRFILTQESQGIMLRLDVEPVPTELPKFPMIGVPQEDGSYITVQLGADVRELLEITEYAPEG